MRTLLVFLLISVFILSGCTPHSSILPQDDKPIIAVSIVPQATFARAIAGDLAEILTVIPRGYSPANYQPTAKTMILFSEASLYFTMGMPTEYINILPKISDFNNSLPIIDMQQAVFSKYDSIYFEDGNGNHDHSAEKPDPHVWLSPIRAIEIVKTMSSGFSELDPMNRDIYQNNADAYIKKLMELDRTIREKIGKLNNKTFLIYHGSYAYLAYDYGLKMLAIEGDGKPASASKLAEIIKIAEAHGITDVFYQDEFDGSQAKTIADELGGNALKLTPLSESYIESILAFIEMLEG